MEKTYCIEFQNENGDTCAIDYFTGTPEDAFAQADYLCKVLRVKKFSIRDTAEI